jgi:hypothetical protein
MSRKDSIQYCKNCVEIFDDYRYVEWDNMEDYQIIKWVVYFKKLLKLTTGHIHDNKIKEGKIIDLHSYVKRGN